MHEDIIIQISNRIKEKRKARGITVQSLASKAQVSKGLISQIENNRTIPSLSVLMNIIKSLDLDLNEFFSNFTHDDGASKVTVKRSKEYHPFEKEPAPGFSYKRILTRNIKNFPIDIVILELKRGAHRSTMVKTEAFEYKYIIQGKVEYNINNQIYQLETGDSLYFDGRLGHKLSNKGKELAKILVVYFFI
jgi:transcriptional regulator with XRE-family HTH domain